MGIAIECICFNWLLDSYHENDGEKPSDQG